LIKPQDKIFSVYRSSAGSGKTRTLAKEFLKLALRYKADYFKHILAVTFTNKASQEMKDRILAYLDDFSKGNQNELALELQEELKLDPQTFQQHSQAVQAGILHQYAQFSISTIDAFFQKVIRSFTRESGLIGDYRLEVDHDAILEEVIDNLIDELGTNKELTEWVVEFAKENLENERAWDVRFSLIEFAREIFREEFKAIEDELSQTTADVSIFRKIKEKLWSTKNFFIDQVSKPAKEFFRILESNGWTIEDFSYKRGSGLLGFFNQFAFETNLSKYETIGGRILNYFDGNPANWPNKKSPHSKAILQAAEQSFVPIVSRILAEYSEHFERALSAEVALKNLYVFGLIADIARKLKEYKSENNVMLLADAPKFLNGVISDSDTPFIYEKVGSFYRNYLIDEFQDTSGMQWKNFQPLITNSLDQGYPGLVVGDVKQAIYRWRGGDLNLLQNEIVARIGEDRVNVRELDRNFRSSKAVVSFNNALFKTAADIVALETGESISKEAYTDVSQEIFKTDAGFVEVRFLRPEPTEEKKNLFSADDAESVQESSNWIEMALDQLPGMMEDLQLRGVRLKEIAILVRRNDEGQRIATQLLHYKNSGKAKEGCRYDVVSNESLRIDGASSVNLLLGALRYLLNADDSIARAQLGYEFARLHEPERSMPEVFAVANLATFENNLPKSFTSQKAYLKKLPLIELTETLIHLFDLGKQKGELVYLQAFQDLVLEFYNRERNDLGAFLDWWEINRKKKSVQIAGEVDAAQILTIHKSKGLQFKYVIIPFCSWSMDHESFRAPNLWVKSDQGPFKEMGNLPVKYGRILEQTYFADDYRKEFTKTYLDNLNLLYVAFTRAELGLMVTAPHPDVRGKGTVANLLYNSIQGSQELNVKWNEALSVYKSGEWSISKTEERMRSESLSLDHYVSTLWRDKLVIRQTGSSYFEQTDEARAKINYGIHTHAVLSRMKYADELESTLKQILLEGLITDEAVDTTRKQLLDLFALGDVASWFSRDWKVQTEVPIILPGGDESRLDRLIYNGKTAIVIDYKTGELRKGDNGQVLAYQQTLREMNFVDVKGYLIYLRNNQVVEVRSGGKEKVVKKAKDKDQLGLGF
jgi:ATP-dependent exoDNAse (exonuclease V) beta subunit